MILTAVLIIFYRYEFWLISLSGLSSIIPIILILKPDYNLPVVIVGEAILLLLLSRMARTDRTFAYMTYYFLLGALIVIEALSFIHWLVFPYYRDFSTGAANFELGFAYLGYFGVKYLVFGLIFSWVILLLPRPKLTKKEVEVFRSPAMHKFLFVLFTLVITFLVGYYPYLRITTRLVGGDMFIYMSALNKVLAGGLGALGPKESDRLLFYALLYAIHLLTGASAHMIYMVLPVILTVCTAATTFLIMKLGSQEFWTSINAALLSALTFNTIAAIYMDLFANWFAYILMAASLGLLMYSLDDVTPRRKMAAALGISVSVLIIFSHTLVWWFTVGVCTIFMLLTLLGKQRRKWTVVVLSAFAIVNVVTYRLRLEFGTEGTLLDASRALSKYSTLGLGLLNGTIYGQFWNNLEYFLELSPVFYGNWVLIILALLGVFVISRMNSETGLRRLIGVWMFLGGMLTIILSNVLDPFYSYTTYWPNVWRGLFMIPIQIPAGIALGTILNNRGGQPLYTLLVLILLNFAFHSLALTILM